VKAMVLAAGLGTRLRPLTNDRPKALVEVGGRTLLEITLSRLRFFGIVDVIVNVHHFADMVVDYLKAHQDFGMNIAVSREDALLDTGGGLRKAAHFFLDDAAKGDQAFILHNVDVISTIDLRRMHAAHLKSNVLATLAVQDRVTSRYLLFDERDRLCGLQLLREKTTEIVRPCPEPRRLAFSGVHVISRRLLELIVEEGAFSIIALYLRLASDAEDIVAFRADEYYWRDLGRPENVKQVSEELLRQEL
jgi:NDP-sugar pyrophosphorylase family protein